MNCERLKIVVHGAVQGVGFRPFVYRLATELELHGSVSNSAQGVFIEVEGGRDSLQTFLSRVEKEKPARAVIQSLESSFLNAIGYRGFEIRETQDRGAKTTLILPDIATCADCLSDIVQPTNRRFRYPFTNCTNCGPRFSIVESLPYDRANTSMKYFTMCSECEREYRDPRDRRFHAQPNACPKCGPQLQWWNEDGEILSERDEALLNAADAIRSGAIVALKGVGGFQLVVDARNESAVARLRERKHREEKPFALLVSALKAACEICEVLEPEKRLLLSPESPIVLLSAFRNYHQSGSTRSTIAASVAPRNPNLGVMLPYSPLHHLLMRELDFPIVATSGNLSDDPICIDEHEALHRLRGIADAFLVHNRPIVRHVDDSIARIMCGRELLLRRARGYAPLPILVRPAITQDQPARSAILSVGAHLKNTVALKIANNIFVSQHIGDLETEQAFAAFRGAADDLPRLYDAKIDLVACDMHPEYLSTKFAAELAPAKIPVQHHWAHIAACMAENEIEAPALGAAWDGTGYGLDGTIWGGEFLLAGKDGSFERVAHLRQFRLPGGDQAVTEPRRSALGILYEIYGEKAWDDGEILSAFANNELSPLRTILKKNINAPLTSSAGRLFDAVAALTGLRQRARFEGQAAMELEFSADLDLREAYPFTLTQGIPMVIDWEPTIQAILSDIKGGESRGAISAKFHNMLIAAIVAIARKTREGNVVLSGGCFQNRLLIEGVVERLREEKFRPVWHQRIPPNDGGIALGQAIAASWKQQWS
jgi:hydrogenase maturation protein HypF